MTRALTEAKIKRSNIDRKIRAVQRLWELEAKARFGAVFIKAQSSSSRQQLLSTRFTCARG